MKERVVVAEGRQWSRGNTAVNIPPAPLFMRTQKGICAGVIVST